MYDLLIKYFPWIIVPAIYSGLGRLFNTGLNERWGVQGAIDDAINKGQMVDRNKVHEYRGNANIKIALSIVIFLVGYAAIFIFLPGLFFASLFTGLLFYFFGVLGFGITFY